MNDAASLADPSYDNFRETLLGTKSFSEKTSRKSENLSFRHYRVGVAMTCRLILCIIDGHEATTNLQSISLRRKCDSKAENFISIHEMCYVGGA